MLYLANCGWSGGKCLAGGLQAMQDSLAGGKTEFTAHEGLGGLTGTAGPCWKKALIIFLLISMFSSYVKPSLTHQGLPHEVSPLPSPPSSSWSWGKDLKIVVSPVYASSAKRVINAARTENQFFKAEINNNN